MQFSQGTAAGGTVVSTPRRAQEVHEQLPPEHLPESRPSEFVTTASRRACSYHPDRIGKIPNPNRLETSTHCMVSHASCGRDRRKKPTVVHAP